MFDSRWRAIQRARRHGTHGSAAKDSLLILAIISMAGAACFWFPAYWRLVSPSDWGEVAQAIAAGAFMVAGPPTLVAFLIPWSPAGMLLQRLHARTWGQAAVIMCGMFLLYFSYTALWAWWETRPGLEGSGLPQQLAVVGLISFIIVPALLWAPVSDEELAEQLKQHQAVQHYKLQTQADIAILRNTLLAAQQKALVGFANLTAAERGELAMVMKGLITGIDQNIQEIAGGLSEGIGMALGVPSLEDNPEIQHLIEVSTKAITASRMSAGEGGETGLLDMSTWEQWKRYAMEMEAEHDRLKQEIDQLRQQLAASRSNASGSVGAVATNVMNVTQGDAGQRRVTQGDAGRDADYERARAALPASWTMKELQQALGIDAESTARELRSAWQQAGLVKAERLKGRYSFTECGEV